MTTRTRKIFLAAFMGMTWFAQSYATIITVTDTGDTVNALDNVVTLREAIFAANTNAPSGDAPAGSPGLDTILFAIPGAPGTVHTISPSMALPPITEAIFIDGYSQFGAIANTMVTGTNAYLTIELDGTNAGFNAGLAISAPGSTVRGLVIRNFANEGILLTGGNNVVQGNFLGTDQTGKLDRGNGIAGVAVVSATNNLIGGTALSERNLISGNDFAGISIAGATANANRVVNNLIGTDDTVTEAIANTGSGVRIANSADNIIGGILAGTGNVIAFNGADGIALLAGALTGNLIAGNAIHSNTGLGIDLADDGVTANDAADADVGANNLQNFPVLTEATSNALGTVIEGTITSTVSTEFRIELFSNTSADASGFGEGQVFLGSVDVTTNAAGTAEFSFVGDVVLAGGALLTATAIDPENNTSEFSATLEVEITAPSVTDEDDDDDGDHEEFIPVPVPVPPLLGPVAPAPVVAPPVGGPHTLPFDKAPKTDFEITVDGLDEGLVPMPTGEAARRSRAHAPQESGCSTAGGSFGLLWSVLIGLYALRRKMHPRWRR